MRLVYETQWPMWEDLASMGAGPTDGLGSAEAKYRRWAGLIPRVLTPSSCLGLQSLAFGPQVLAFLASIKAFGLELTVAPLAAPVLRPLSSTEPYYQYPSVYSLPKTCCGTSQLP